MLRSTILCLFEGERREHEYFYSLQSKFFNEEQVDIVKCSYGNDIFELFEELEKDDDLNLFDLVKESVLTPNNKILLERLTSEDVNQIYLFFDMECQDDKYDASTLTKMLEIFNLEDDKGKLFLSYPMVEALRDVPSLEDYKNLKVDVENCRGKKYKKLSADRGMNYLHQIKKLTLEDWKELIKANVEKTNYFIEGRSHFETCYDQKEILDAQIKSIDTDNHIYVLSAYPLFAFYHFPKGDLNL